MENSDDFLNKTKEFAEKAETKLKEEFAKLKESETYAKFSDLMESASSFAGQKIDEFKKGEYQSQTEEWREQAETVVDHLRAVGTIIAGDVEEAIDAVKEKFSGESKKNDNVPNA